MKQYSYDYWLREHFILQIPNYVENSVVFMYGPNTFDAYPESTPLKYNERTLIKNICDLLSIDVILIAQKSRTFINYHPGRDKMNESWLPKDFASFDEVPKIVIEEDYHYEKNDKWYVENGIDLILQRHYSQLLRQEKVPMKWFPFSVDTEVFKLNDVDRTQRFCLTGSLGGSVYKHRESVYHILTRLGVVDGFVKREMTGYSYIKNLQQYVSHICCGSAFDITPAKAFEIMASGSVLFTNRFSGINELFPDDAYCFYKEDYSDVEGKVNWILNDSDYVDHTVAAGLQCIAERHSHEYRINELMVIIDEVLT